MEDREVQGLRDLNWGFALSGGGAKGAYTAGVMFGLHEAGILTPELENVKVIVGVSTGSLVAAGVATGDFETLKQVYTTVTTPEIIRPSRPVARKLFGFLGMFAANAVFGPPYLYDTSPLRALVRKHVGEDGFRRMIERKNDFDVSFVSVDLASGEVRPIGNQTKGVTPEALEDAVLASTNQPVLMDLVTIDGNLHGDGGVREFLPASQLMRSPLASQLDVFVTIPLAPGKGPAPVDNPQKIFDILQRTVALLSYEVGDADTLSTELVDAIIRLREAIGEARWKELMGSFSPRVQDLLGRLRAPDSTFQFLEIRPSRMPVKDPLEFDPAQMQEAFELGRQEASSAVERWYEASGRAFVAERAAGRKDR